MSDVVTMGVAVQVPEDTVHEGKRVKVVVDGGRVVRWVLADDERLLVTNSSVLVNVGKVLHDDMLITLAFFCRCSGGDRTVSSRDCSGVVQGDKGERETQDLTLRALKAGRRN